MPNCAELRDQRRTGLKGGTSKKTWSAFCGFKRFLGQFLGFECATVIADGFKKGTIHGLVILSEGLEFICKAP